MKTRLLLVLMVSIIAGCSKVESPKDKPILAKSSFTINDAEKIGLNKTKQKAFQMIGAVDGWSGTLEGEKVELYQFSAVETTPKDLFATSTSEGNISGWVEKCTVANLIMLSKGDKACSKLKSLLNT